METVTIHEAKTHFSKHVAAVEQGKTIVVTRYGKPVARIVPLEDHSSKRGRKRILGVLKNEVDIDWDEFERIDKELDAEIIADFEKSIKRPLF